MTEGQISLKGSPVFHVANLLFFQSVYSCFTVVCWFLLYNNLNQLCVYMCPLPLQPPSHPSRSSQSTELSSLYYTAASHYLNILHMAGLPGGSAGKEPTCNTGDLGSIPGLGRSPREGNTHSIDYTGQCSQWGRKELDTTEQLSLSLYKRQCMAVNAALSVHPTFSFPSLRLSMLLSQFIPPSPSPHCIRKSSPFSESATFYSSSGIQGGPVLNVVCSLQSSLRARLAMDMLRLRGWGA